jgi:hypothetical protein
VDPQILLIQAFALHISLLGAAWLSDRVLLLNRWGLLRLAIPATMAILGLIIDDTYASPGQRSASLVRGPVLGLPCAMASQEMVRIASSDFALPRWVMIYGCSMSLLLSCAVRVWFPPINGLLHGANAPADWLKRAVGWPESMLGSIRVLKGVFAVVTVAMIGTRTIVHSPSSKLRIVPVLLVLWIAYQIWKRG